METAKKHYKTIFISDVHLGSRGCQAEALIRFLKESEADEIYLIGDIIDGWRMRKGVYWPQSHSDVIREILKKAHNGTEIHYIIGNHDEFLRKWLMWDLRFGRVHLTNQKTHVGVNGKQYLVIHGDMFDVVMRKELKWLMRVGDVAYNFLLWANTKLNWVRYRLGLPYWSLSNYLKQRTKRALNYMSSYEENLVDYVKKNNYDGIFCGHIHNAKIENMNGIEYMNTGDWVESCTAIVEHESGKFELIEYKVKK